MFTQKQGLELYALKLREMHDVALTENATLRSRQLPDAQLLAQKQAVAEDLDAALQLLTKSVKSSGTEQEQARALQLQIQEEMLQIIMLDRENESLLLKATWRQSRDAVVTVDLGMVRSLYGTGVR